MPNVQITIAGAKTDVELARLPDGRVALIMPASATWLTADSAFFGANPGGVVDEGTEDEPAGVLATRGLASWICDNAYHATATRPIVYTAPEEPAA